MSHRLQDHYEVSQHRKSTLSALMEAWDAYCRHAQVENRLCESVTIELSCPDSLS